MGKMAQSIEPNIADLGNSWLKSYNLDYKLEQESLNTEIDKALSDYFTKNGGAGANRPDAKLLLKDKNLNYYPILNDIYQNEKGLGENDRVYLVADGNFYLCYSKTRYKRGYFVC